MLQKIILIGFGWFQKVPNSKTECWMSNMNHFDSMRMLQGVIRRSWNRTLGCQLQISFIIQAKWSETRCLTPWRKKKSLFQLLAKCSFRNHPKTASITHKPKHLSWIWIHWSLIIAIGRRGTWLSCRGKRQAQWIGIIIESAMQEASVVTSFDLTEKIHHSQAISVSYRHLTVITEWKHSHHSTAIRNCNHWDYESL